MAQYGKLAGLTFSSIFSGFANDLEPRCNDQSFYSFFL